MRTITDDERVDAVAAAAIMSYLKTRCEVSSQHRLPTEDEIVGTVFAAFLGPERVRRILREMVKRGVVRSYGPHLSDRPVDVL